MSVLTPKALHSTVGLYAGALHSTVGPYAEGVTFHSRSLRRGVAFHSWPLRRRRYIPQSVFTPRALHSTVGLYAGSGTFHSRSLRRRRCIPLTSRALHSTVGPYAEGVTFHSPGSRRGEAAKRTLGPGPTSTQIPRRGFTKDVDPSRGHDACRIEPAIATSDVLLLCNAFGVWGGWVIRRPRVRRDRRLRRRARRPWALEFNRFAVKKRRGCRSLRRERYIPQSVFTPGRYIPQSVLTPKALHSTVGLYAGALHSTVGPYAEGVTFHSPGSRRGEAAKRTLGPGPTSTRIPRRGFTKDMDQSQT